jgi:hypothetical protein
MTRTWADQFNTYQDACDFYGCDGPRELALEARIEAEEAAIEAQDWMEAHGSPYPDWRKDWTEGF